MKSINLDNYEKSDEKVPKKLWKVKPNDKYGFCTVLSKPYYLIYKKRQQKEQFVNCKCICGKELPIQCRYLIRSNDWRSCGCKSGESKKTKGSYAKDGFKICSSCSQNFETYKFAKVEYSKDKFNPNCGNCQYIKMCACKYKISKDEIKNLISNHKLNCQICNQKILLPNDRVNKKDKKETLCIDHCHITGKVRGLLCQSCNSLLGMSKDDINILHSAIKYLTNSI